MDNEIKMAFELAYLPLAHARERLNGKDFLGVAVFLMDYVREQTADKEKIHDAAFTIVHTFNDMLNPMFQEEEVESMIGLLVRNDAEVRVIAQQSQEENKDYIMYFL